MNRLRTAMAALSLIIAGFCSAGLSHGAIWSLTALRAINGSYLAYRHDAIAAATLSAAIVGGVVGVVALACAFASGVRGGDAWVWTLHRAIADIGPLRAFLVVVAVQFGVIIGLEAAEQIVQLGHTLGPAAALGAPLAAGIPIHALCALVVVALLFGVARAVVRAEARIRSMLSPHFHRRSRSSPVAELIRPYRAAEDIACRAPSSSRFANRPPPSIAA